MQFENQWRSRRTHANGVSYLLLHCSPRNLLPPAVAILPAKMRTGFHVSGVGSYQMSLRSSDISICLVVFSLLAEVPHDVKFFWRYVRWPLTPIHHLRVADRMSAWVDLALMALTFFCTIVWNVEIGVAASLIISLLLVVHRSSKTRMTILVCILPLIANYAA